MAANGLLAAPASAVGGESGRRRRPPARSWLLFGLVGLVVALAVALTLALTRPPDGPTYPGNTSADAGFARDMQQHHAQAIELALIVREAAAGDAQMREFASDMALSQQREIGQMHALLAVWDLPPVGPQGGPSWMATAPQPHAGADGSHATMPGLVTEAEMDRLRDLRGDAAAMEFLRLMIPHHRGGTVMAEAALALAQDRVLRNLATTILTVQRSEILLMQQMIRLRGGTPRPEPTSVRSLDGR